MILGIGFAIAAMSKTLTNTSQEVTKKLTVTPVIEVRERFERRDGVSFNTSKDSNRSDLFNRERVGFKFQDGNDLKGQLVYQYSSNPYWTEPSNASTYASDVPLGYVSQRVGSGWLTGGIQRLAIGNQRLLGECCEWNNYGISWDAIRFQASRFDAFAGQLTLAPKESKYARLVGADYDSFLGKTLFYFNHDRDNVGSVAESYNVYTIDQDYKRKVKGVTLEAEGAFQTGDEASNEVRAFATVGRVSKDFGSKFSAYIDGQMMSGGQEHGKIMDFTTPYGQNHIYNGSMDIQGGSNKRSLALEGDYKFSPKIDTELIYTRIGLFDDRDAWYGKYFVVNKTGSTSFVDPTGKKGGDVGQELDFATKWRFQKNTELNVGASEFIPGNFVKAFIPSGHAQNQVWLYTQISYKF